LDGWGMEDLDVGPKFAEIAARPPARSAEFAYLFPRIIRNADECRSKLLSLLQDPSCRRPDLVLEGLRTLGGPKPDTEVVDAVVRCDPSRPNVLWMDREHCTMALIRGYHGDSRVRDLARQQFSTE